MSTKGKSEAKVVSPKPPGNQEIIELEWHLGLNPHEEGNLHVVHLKRRWLRN